MSLKNNNNMNITEKFIQLIANAFTFKNVTEILLDCRVEITD